ncbi:unnamed protein product, partial [Discosporangium mesarthrocarpum]
MRGGEVSVQQDGPTPHTCKGNPDWLSEAGKRQGFYLKLCTQPAQSPDLNNNDLGPSVSQDQDSVQELVDGVFKEYEECHAKTLEREWQSLFKVYNLVLVAKGGNDFSVEHRGIKVTQRAGKLTKRVKIDRGAFSEAMKFL